MHVLVLPQVPVCTRFEVHSFLLSSKHFLGWCAEPAQRGGFVFPLLPVCFCRAVQAEFVRRVLSVPLALCARRFVCFLLCACSETVNLKVNTSVGDFDSTR